ncbi:MAG: hypothetical protein EBS74_05455 [Flavobacteriia bacterium]|nr:hypothetical protein [Flavobacteriia bacterium]
MAKRSAPEVNAGSMADIAFLLLIFFLVTTTIETDSGINRKLPPIEDIEDPPIIKEKNIFNVESWLIHHGDKLKNRFLLQAYKTMNHLLASIDITRKNKTLEKVVENIQSNIHLIAVDSDLFFTAQEDRKTHERLKKINKNIFYHEIQSIHGHDAFLIENDAVSRILSNIFKSQSIDLKAYKSSSQ